MRFRWHIVSVLLLFCLNLFAQTSTYDTLLEDILEQVAEKEQLDRTRILEQLHYYHTHPINLNTATAEDLQDLFFLSPLQIGAILSWRTKTGAFLHLLELQSLDLFTFKDYERLSHFVTVSDPNVWSWGSLETEFLQRASIDKYKSIGYTLPDDSNNKYQGNLIESYSMLRARLGDAITLGLNYKKNAGEPSKIDLSTSGAFFKKNDAIISRIAIGNYALQYGQGLSLFSGYAPIKTPDIYSLAQTNSGLKSYIRNGTQNALSGIASTFCYKRISFTPFLSYRKWDANLDTLNGNVGFTSLSYLGLYRNNNEISKRDELKQIVGGFASTYEHKGLTLGTTAYQLQWSLPAINTNEALYKKYTFVGNSSTMMSFFYNYFLRNIYFFGEFAHNISAGKAFLNGIMVSLSQRLTLMTIYRDYAPNYYPFLGNPLSENSSQNNEKGIYAGLHLKISTQWDWQAYTDHYVAPWLKYQLGALAQGEEYCSQINYTHGKDYKVYLRYRYIQKPITNTNSKLDSYINGYYHSYRIELEKWLNTNLSTMNRLEITSFQKGGNSTSWGYLMIQDITLKRLFRKLNFGFRLAIFDIDSYDNRIYALENSALYHYSMGLFQNKGIKTYVNLHYPISKKWSMWLRYTWLKYFNTETIGSSYDAIQSNSQENILLQLRWGF